MSDSSREIGCSICSDISGLSEFETARYRFMCFLRLTDLFLLDAGWLTSEPKRLPPLVRKCDSLELLEILCVVLR